MRIAVLSLLISVLAACGSSGDVINPESEATDACPSMDIQGLYTDTTNAGRANGHSFSWETNDWSVIPVGELIDARVRGEINTDVVTDDGTAVPITVSVLTDVVHPFFVVCNFEDLLVTSEVATRDGSSIQSVSGTVSGHFVAGREPAVLNGEYEIRIVLEDGSTAAHSDTWQARIM